MEEENPFKMDQPNIDPLMPDLNTSILSAERQKSNITSNPWEISEGDDILKSIMDIKNKPPSSSPPMNDTIYPSKKDNDLKFNDFGTSSTPNFKVNDPWAAPLPLSQSVFESDKNNNENDFSNFATININTDSTTSNVLNDDIGTSTRPNSTVISSATSSMSQPSIKSPINYTNPSQSFIATTNYLNSNDNADVLNVKISPEKSGIVFKHVNYLIHSKLHKKSSIRRYSDFFWLHEILCKRYQFRIMINLPPKHNIGTSSNDLVFLEKRRRGLSRFINYIGNHPVMKNDEFYLKFIDKECDLIALKKNTSDIQEEYEMAYLSSDHMKQIPIDFDKNLTNLRSGLSFLIDQFQSLYNSMEKIGNNFESSSNEYTNIGYSLGQMSEFKDYLGFDSYNFKLLHNGYAQLADGFQKISKVLHENYQSTLDTIVDNLETQREILGGFDNLLVSRDAITSKININLVHIEKRINATMEKLLDNNLKDKDKERLEQNVTQDQKDKSALERKLVFIKYSVFCEANFLESQKTQIATMYSEFIQLQYRMASMLQDEWKLLSVSASKLPIGTF